MSATARVSHLRVHATTRWLLNSYQHLAPGHAVQMTTATTSRRPSGNRAVAAAAGAREAPQCTDKGHEPSDPKDLHSLSEANRDPVRLGHGPLQLVDGAASLVGQDRALDRSRKRLQVPY